MAAGARAGRWEALADRRARSVWLVISLTTTIFALLCVVVGVAASRYLTGVTVQQSGNTLELHSGSQLSIERSGTVGWEVVSSRVDFHEGDVAQTGPSTSAFVKLFDGSTIQTYFDTSILLQRVRTSQFFSQAREVRVVLTGTAVIATGDLGDATEADYVVDTGQAEITMANNSRVRVRVSGSEDQEATYVTVDNGSATMVSRGGRAVITPGMMGLASSDGKLSGPVPAEDELVRNGNFSEPPTSEAEQQANGGLGTAGWDIVRDQPSEVTVDPGVPSLVTETLPPPLGTINAVEFNRDKPSEPYVRQAIHQDLNQPVEFVHSLELTVTVRIALQNEPVGGPQGDLFPLTVRVIYTDPNQQQHDRKYNFFYVTQQPDPGYPRQVALGSWAVKNLVLKSGSTVGPDIAVVNAIEIYGYGSQFRSWVAAVSMIAR